MKYFAICTVTVLSLILLISNIESATSNKQAITTFLDALDEKQMESAMFDFDHEKRKDWHFLPEKSYPRTGLGLDKMNEDLRSKLHQVLATALSEVGYKKTITIISLESVLAELGEDPSYRDPNLYSIAFFGNPKEDKVWSWSFGGHHIALSFTYVNGKLSMSPRFFGANPAVVPSGRNKGLAVLDDEEQGGLELINSMTADQRQKAIIRTEAYNDILTKNKDKVAPLDSEGISVSEMNEDQVQSIRSLIDVYLSSIPSELAKQRMDKINQEDFSQVLFAWAGATEQFKAHYYRIQGKSFLIEFDNAQNNANHIHTVWRDFDGDFGEDLIKLHREKHKH